MADRTFDAVERQVRAMGADMFEIGLFKPMDGVSRHAEMLPRVWNVDVLIKSVPWLKFQNSDGRNIYIRPKGEHALSLVDDLTAETLNRMKDAGFAPSIVLETSPGNFQAWLNHGRVLPRTTSSAAARALADRFGGDRGSADWRHYGRLAGFTNRKAKHRQHDGRFPFVRLVRSEDAVYPKATEFLQQIDAQVEIVRRDAERRRQRADIRLHPSGVLKSIDDFRRDPRYGGDGNRIDLAYAVYALLHGVPEEQVRAHIMGRDLNHKGNERRQADYVDRTIRKALLAFKGEELGR
jgi:hypothetical protein